MNDDDDFYPFFSHQTILIFEEDEDDHFVSSILNIDGRPFIGWIEPEKQGFIGFIDPDTYHLHRKEDKCQS